MAETDSKLRIDGLRRAVVADDDEFFRLALTSILTRHLGFAEVVETASLDEALERLGEGPAVELALFDLSMPGMETVASLGAVRECAPQTKAVVVSASTSRRDILACLEAGVHGYVPKSAGAVEIARALESVLAGTIYVPSLLAEAPAEGSGGEAAASEAGGDVGPLTPRQREVLALLVAGKANKEIARALKLSEGTVKIHVASLLRALRVPNRSAAAVAGLRIVGQPPGR